jgi:uncharacterized protein YgiM (DUF1202 family)
MISLTACQKELPESFTNKMEEIKTIWTPDKRTSVFEYKTEFKEGMWQIEGETSVPEAYQQVSELVRTTFTEDEINLNFQLLPPEEFADTTNALVNVSVGNLRSKPSHRAELVDQVLMGTTVKLLKAHSYWYLVQTPTNYLGWTTRGTLERVSDSDLVQWQESEKLSLNTNYAQIFMEKSEKSQVISDLVLGSIVKKIKVEDVWTEIELPDGRAGFVKSENLLIYQMAAQSTAADRNRLIERAKTMMGIPYMWGGHSTKAFDCSGFTSTVFRTEGIQLPRDASMQVVLGEEVIADSNYTNVIAGDLIFFGSSKSITHVGICLGGAFFIHCSGDVHINSLDKNDELFNAYRKRTFRHIKRIIKN